MPRLHAAVLLSCVLMAIDAPGAEPKPSSQQSVLSRYRGRATEREPFWTAAAERAHVLYQDGGMSIAMPDGSTLWTFGDTFLGQGKNKDGTPKFEGGVSSTGCRVHVTPKGPTVEYLTNAKGIADFLLPLAGSETWTRHRVWPAGGITADGTTYLYFIRVVINGQNVFGFDDDGVGLARAKNGTAIFERLVMPKSDPPIPVLPVCVLADNGSLYLYSIEKTGAFDSRVILARVLATEADRPGSYRFWSGGNSFSTSKNEAATLVADVWGQTSVAWNRYLKHYVMLHVGGIFHEPRTVFLRTSETLYGPWSSPTAVFSLPGKLGKDFSGLIYCAYLHPELFRDDGRVMAFSYCTQQKELTNPHLVEIELQQ